MCLIQDTDLNVSSIDSLFLGACLFWYNTCHLPSLSGNSVIALDMFFVILLSHSFSFILPFTGYILYILPIPLGTMLTQFCVSSFSCGPFCIYISGVSHFFFVSVAPYLLPPSMINCFHSKMNFINILVGYSRTLPANNVMLWCLISLGSSSASLVCARIFSFLKSWQFLPLFLSIHLLPFWAL